MFYLFCCLACNCFVGSGSPPGAPQSGGPAILELPVDKIRRPLMRTRANDPQKVKELMDSISEIGLQVPVRLFFLFVFSEFNSMISCLAKVYSEA